MKQYSYIQRVLSHISGKARKREIEYELFDHLDEKEQYWEAIGYDESASTEKAETAMGDADITGERLEGIKKPSRIIQAICISLSLISFSAYAIILYRHTIGYIDEGFSTSLRSNYVLLLSSAVVLFGCINTFYGLRHKQYSNVLIGSTTTEISLLLGPYVCSEYITSLLQKNDYYAEFYYNYESNHLLFQQLSVYDILLLLLSFCIFLFIVIVGLRYIYRVKHMINNKNEIKIKNLLLIVNIAVLLLTTLFDIAYASHYQLTKDKNIQSAYVVYTELEHRLLENHYLIYDNYEYGISVDGFCTIGENIPYPVSLNLSYSIPLPVKADILNRDYFIEHYSDIYDAPIPRTIEYSESENETTVILTYDGDNYYFSAIYSYDNNTGQYYFIDDYIQYLDDKGLIIFN